MVHIIGVNWYSHLENGDIHYVPQQIELEEAIARRLNIPITSSNEPLIDLIKQVQRSYSTMGSKMSKYPWFVNTNSSAFTLLLVHAIPMRRDKMLLHRTFGTTFS